MIHRNAHKAASSAEATRKTSASDKVYQDVTRRILDRMMQGEIPWRQTWTPEKNGISPFRNPYTKVNYGFLNQLLLVEPGLYATFNQIKEHGGHVLKGHKSKRVFFWSKYIPKKHQEEAEKLKAEGKSVEHLKQPCLMTYDVFNLEKDTEGIDLSKFREEVPKTQKAQDPTDILRMVVGDFKVNESISVEEDNTRDPFYDACQDKVITPEMSRFGIEEDYWASLLSGFVHSTAHEERMNRKAELEKMLKGEMSPREWLIGEIGTSMILSACGLVRDETHEQIAATCQKCIEILQKDYRVLINSAGAAESSAKYILGTFAA